MEKSAGKFLIDLFLAVSRSPIFSHFAESSNGSVTIRSYNMQQKFLTEFMKRCDDNEKCFYWHFAANRWLVFFIGNFIETSKNN